MRSHCTVWVLAAFVAFVWTARGQATESFFRQTIVNDSGQPANDLHLEFTERVDEAKCRPATQPPGKDGEGTLPPYPNNTHADFAPPIFGTVAGVAGSDPPPDNVAYIDYGYSSYDPFIDSDNSYWTSDGIRLAGFKRQGLPFHISHADYDEPSCLIRNTEATRQAYAVWLYTDNQLADFTIDSYFIPTGALQTVASFELEPNDELVLLFGPGPAIPETYLLAIGEGGPVSDPSDRYLMYSAAKVVPEPIFVAGDLDKNGKVDIFDVAVLQTKYGMTSGATWGDGDFDGNGTVDIFDVAAMQVNYGYGVAGSPAPVPEPSTLVLAAMGLASLACGRYSRHRR
ncbi:MAG: PEP-CTERM sorting domain-containing protein [Pirellulales bacterium]